MPGIFRSQPNAIQCEWIRLIFPGKSKSSPNRPGFGGRNLLFQDIREDINKVPFPVLPGRQKYRRFYLKALKVLLFGRMNAVFFISLIAGSQKWGIHGHPPCNFSIKMNGKDERKMNERWFRRRRQHCAGMAGSRTQRKRKGKSASRPVREIRNSLAVFFPSTSKTADSGSSRSSRFQQLPGSRSLCPGRGGSR